MCETKEPICDELGNTEDLTILDDLTNHGKRDYGNADEVEDYDIFNPPESDPYP